MRVTRDVKGFLKTLHKRLLHCLTLQNHDHEQFMLTISMRFRSQHDMYENMKPLFANPVLPLLTIALADRAFQDYATFEEIEAIPPPADGSLHHLRIKKDMLRVPFFQIVSADGPTGKIQGAGSFSNRTVDLGHRAGNEETSEYTTFEGKLSSKPMISSWDGTSLMRYVDSVEITGTRSPKGWDSQATTNRIPSSAHTRLSCVPCAQALGSDLVLANTPMKTYEEPEMSLLRDRDAVLGSDDLVFRERCLACHKSPNIRILVGRKTWSPRTAHSYCHVNEVWKQTCGRLGNSGYGASRIFLFLFPQGQPWQE